MAKLSCKQVAERLGVSYVVAAGVVKYLVAAGKATIVEKVFHASGKGKPVRFYEIAEDVALDLSEKAVVAEVTVEGEGEDVAEAA
jgi:predicted ArsR family transcriptional regulator